MKFNLRCLCRLGILCLFLWLNISYDLALDTSCSEFFLLQFDGFSASHHTFQVWIVSEVFRCSLFLLLVVKNFWIFKMVRLTIDLIENSPQYVNTLRDRELSLRACKIPVLENVGATMVCVKFIIHNSL